MSNQFTPGPWKVAGSCHVKKCVDGRFFHVAHVAVADDFADNPMIAEISSRGYYGTEKQSHNPSPEQFANARLIAAAPALYEALREVPRTSRIDLDLPRFKDDADTVDIRVTIGWLREARAALALVDSVSPKGDSEACVWKPTGTPGQEACDAHDGTHGHYKTRIIK